MSRMRLGNIRMVDLAKTAGPTTYRTIKMGEENHVVLLHTKLAVTTNYDLFLG